MPFGGAPPPTGSGGGGYSPYLGGAPDVAVPVITTPVEPLVPLAEAVLFESSPDAGRPVLDGVPPTPIHVYGGS